MRVLLTGGAGYIGSHTALAVLAGGHEPVLLDNFSNCTPAVVDRLALLAERPVTIIAGDVRDVSLVRSTIAAHQVEAVIHFAAHKAVADSVADPLAYYANNVGGTLSLLEAMDAQSVRTIVFSSSATVYGEPDRLPITEDQPTEAVNPYGRTKAICETVLSDLARGGKGWRVSLLRYFNPVGAHPSGLIGEDPLGTPTNLMPLIVRAALGVDTQLQIFGRDFPTADGTAIRDYIHVVDLAEGHVAALAGLGSGDALQVFNLGTGRGTSVLEMIAAFEQATGQMVPTVDSIPRVGDVAELYAAVGRAEAELGWRASRGLAEMCTDSWRFATRNQQAASQS